MWALAAVVLIQVTGPDGQRIDLNPSQIVSLREPRVSEHVAAGTRCIIHTTGGKFIATVNECEEILRRLAE